MCVHFLWVHILCCFINRASNALLDKAREHGAGRCPPVQSLLLLVLGLRQSFMGMLYNSTLMGQCTHREENTGGTCLVGIVKSSFTAASCL